MKRPPVKITIIWFLLLIVLITGAFSLALCVVIEIRLIFHLNLPPIITYLLSAYLGIFFTWLFIFSVSKFFHRQRIDAFTPIIQALDKIAKGDFNIYLDNREENDLLNDLVNSVNHMASQLGQMETMRQEFISNVSHEIQSPLTSVRGFTQALMEDDLSVQDRRHYLNIIEMESKRLSQLTENLLKLASLDSDQAEIDLHPYALDKQIRSIILTNEPQWRDKQLDIDVSLKPLMINADEALMHQVWTNLLHNSIKFTPSGGKITINLFEKESSIIFTIRDSGIGIYADDRIHIFERFYKADKSRSQTIPGSGLGLSIVKRIVELHHGSVEVESQPGEGTIFMVILQR
jgi:signal transduction histidine kinase